MKLSQKQLIEDTALSKKIEQLRNLTFWFNFRYGINDLNVM